MTYKLGLRGAMGAGPMCKGSRDHMSNKYHTVSSGHSCLNFERILKENFPTHPHLLGQCLSVACLTADIRFTYLGTDVSYDRKDF